MDVGHAPHTSLPATVAGKKKAESASKLGTMQSDKNLYVSMLGKPSDEALCWMEEGNKRLIFVMKSFHRLYYISLVCYLSNEALFGAGYGGLFDVFINCY